MVHDSSRSVMRARLNSATAEQIVLDVETADGVRQLEYRSPEPIWAAPPSTLDFAAVALAQTAAAADLDLVLEGPVTAAQLDRLDEYIQIWSIWRPDRFHRIQITADEEVSRPAPAGRGGAVMGFSGGVDASYALAAHSTASLGRLSTPIDLGVLVIGWDIKHGDDGGRERAREAAARGLDAYGAGTAVVSTNWVQDFCAAWFMSFNAGLTAILHTFADTHAAAVHATDHNYRDELRMPPYGSNMAINHLLGNPAFPVVSTGGLHSRIERVAFLADHPVLLDDLRVCYQEGAAGANCGHCEKCVRTQLELHVNGLPATAFPSPMTLDDLRAAKVTNATVLMHFEDVHRKLGADDPLRGPVGEWVRREQLAEARRRNRPMAKVADLELEVAAARAEVADVQAQLADARAELAALRASNSWRVTRPLRSTTERLRSLKSSLSSGRATQD